MAERKEHLIATLDPAEYVMVGYADFHHEDGFSVTIDGDRWDGAATYEGHFTERGYCDVCGTGRPLRNAVFFVHEPTNEVVTVGETCAYKMDLDGRDKLDFELQRRKAANAEVRAKIENDRRLWLAEAGQDARDAMTYLDEVHERAMAAGEMFNQALRDAGGQIDEWGEYPDDVYDAAWTPEYKRVLRDNRILAGFNGAFLSDIHEKAKRWGGLTPKQVNAALRARDRGVVAMEKEIAEREAANPVPVTKDRIEITGEVVMTKWKEDAYGGKLVMIVRDDRGFKAWGTVPSGLGYTRSGGRVRMPDGTETVLWEEDFWNRPKDAELIETIDDALEPGDRVTFMAAITPADDDECFGFYKRPTKAKRLETEGAIA